MPISTHAPAGGATGFRHDKRARFIISTHAPAGGATCAKRGARLRSTRFLLTPLREGRLPQLDAAGEIGIISTHAPAGGATQDYHRYPRHRPISTHAPAGGATRISTASNCWSTYFYSRPCGRGDHRLQAGLPHHPRISTHAPAGGATVKERKITVDFRPISTHAPAGGATYRWYEKNGCGEISTHAPAGGATADLRLDERKRAISTHAPAGGATTRLPKSPQDVSSFLLTPLREGRHAVCDTVPQIAGISTHAPAGGATAIFHKSVMRFCGKLPKDDTVLCLASFGFPRRDPKAVYLAWISCANLPQKCVREGLALKDQGTSCFHEGLASHAFDPVLV